MWAKPRRGNDLIVLLIICGINEVENVKVSLCKQRNYYYKAQLGLDAIDLSPNHSLRQLAQIGEE